MPQPTKLPVKTARARSRATLPFDVAVTELPDRVAQVVASSPRFTLKSMDAVHASISVGVSWRAWGGIMELHFVTVTETTSQIEATWAPVIPTTLVDSGQGAKDIRALFDGLNQGIAL